MWPHQPSAFVIFYRTETVGNRITLETVLACFIKTLVFVSLREISNIQGGPKNWHSFLYANNFIK